MIQIQIASAVNEQGVSDICWVLLDPADEQPTALVQPAASPATAAAIGANGKTARPGATDRRAGAQRQGLAARSAAEPRGAASSEHERAVNPPAGQAGLVHQVLRVLILACALAGAWWLATTKVQSTTSVNTSAAKSSAATPQAKPELTAHVSRP